MDFSTKLIELLSSGYIKNSRAIQRELQHGENPNLVHPIYGVSAMHLASGQGEEATQLLLLHRGDPNVISVEGLTPLHVAASWGDWKALQLLLKSGADINIQDQDGKTPYDLAVESQNVECAQILKCHVMKRIKRNLTFLGYGDQGKKFTAYDNCKNVIRHRDISVNEFGLPSRLCSDTITERVYKYLEEGKQVCFDATSPNNPVLGMKQTEIADDNNHSRGYQKHPPQTFCHRFQGLQDTGVQNISLSPESHNGYNRSSPIHDHCTCIRNSHMTMEAAASCTHPRHVYPVYASKQFDEQFCNICSRWHLNTPGQTATCTRPSMLHESYRHQSCPECCSLASSNNGSWFCKHNCRLHSVTLPTGVKSSSPSFHQDNTSCKSSVINRECMQVGARRHCRNVADIDTAAIKPWDCHTTDFNVNTPACHNCKTSYVNNVTSRYGHDASSPSKDKRNQKEYNYFNKHLLPAPESSSEVSEAFVKGSSTDISECEYEQQRRVDKLQGWFSSVCNFDDASSTDNQTAPLSDYFSTELSELHRCSSKTEHGNVIPVSQICQDSDSGVTFTSGKLFPPLLNGSVQSSCFDGSTFSKIKDSYRTKIENVRKKAKRKSLLKPQETATTLPKSHMKPHERVAEFILSVQNYMSSSDCINNSFNENISPVLTRSDKGTQFTEGHVEKSMYHADQTENLNKMVARTSVSLNTSESSVDTFATCDEGYSDTTTNVNVVTEQESKVGKASSTQKMETTEKSTDLIYVQTRATENSPSKWKPPTSVLPDDDIMTSDDSFVRKTSARIYRMKMKYKIANHNDGAPTREQRTHTFSRNDYSASRNDHSASRNDHSASRYDHSASRNYTNLVSDQEVTQKDTLPQIFPVKKRLSSDSLFSSVSSVKEYIYEDKEKNITLIERHIPSDYGSSVGRRSLDSTTSKRTIDSEATLIYDWQALNTVLKAENLEAQRQSFSVFDTQCTTVCDISCNHNNVASLQGSNSDQLSPCENVSCTTDDGENAAAAIIPAHLEHMTCQEISQELQKYGEIPGPVIPATRQAYLRRLTTLQSNPGLVVLSKACPDYPSEMRQALNGQFEISRLAELESNMIDVFSVPKTGNCWREGTEKSSFTYLLLDPRITENLPLRSKNLSDLEVFKTFICSIFYIGKGKRSRPYSHLYEAVSKMNKVNVKMNAKVKQIIDVWNAGLGVVSLHCFQSVIPVEAYTREACMIQAIGLHKLTNMKHGGFYGAASSWTAVQRRKMGVYLLKKALQIFLAEGERQICLPDLKTNQS